ncbi:dihydrolipoamide acetyltransferase family protein [Subtercola lobariae]|uniref:Dihydrolipoamide acetyltransferase component of pyruvate dehydrogenase complex n=1 Tax=Subtercola lobariae TaxID=1588641 RepID=A0A917B4M6_9MICO|nr:2-oxo acid dehydrogenase subunit E2 [Subtercola lobariae]GGF21361.1 hypothetical protein GCM10011399_13790 [Subtercola lobariae]
MSGAETDLAGIDSAVDAQQTTLVSMPALGESVTEGTLTRWLKNEGDTVEEGEPLLEVATDKVDTEVPSPVSGVIVRLIAAEDDVVAVGDDLALIAIAGASVAPGGGGGSTVNAVNAVNATDSVGLLGSGAAAVAEDPAPPPAPVPPVAPPAPAAAPATAPGPQVPLAEGDRREKLSSVRRVIADRMMYSLQHTAQLTSFIEVDVTEIAKIRAAFKAKFAESGAKISYLPFFAKAAVDALADSPAMNSTSSESGTEVTYHRAVNLGIAVDSPKGLMVPVIRAAGSLSVFELAAGIEGAAEKVRSGGISPADFEGGTFTLTNTGSRGALFDTPILNYPQTAILGTGIVTERVVPLPGPELTIGVRSFCYFALTYDHRVVDGADAARYLSAVKKGIEGGFAGFELPEHPAAGAAR